MKTEQVLWTQEQGWPSALSRSPLGATAQLVLVFGCTEQLKQSSVLEFFQNRYPHAHLLFGSTAGEIIGTEVRDNSVVATAIAFDHTTLHGAMIQLNQSADSYHAGRYLAQQLDPSGLVHVFVLSDGLQANGSDLVKGLTHALPSHVTITGGLAGDGAAFQETLVGLDVLPQSGCVVALGLYSERLLVGFGSLGGWDSFGPERLITRSQGNVLYELDGKPALDLYKAYLGEYADGLPATGLYFPLSVRDIGKVRPVVRSILACNEDQHSLTFAGDLPEGGVVRLMKANFDRLVVGAAGAAQTSFDAVGSVSPTLAILISCVGRKLVLKQRIEEEVESVRHILGAQTTLTGFYSYGEISPFAPGAACELHNQTMAITTLIEQ